VHGVNINYACCNCAFTIIFLILISNIMFADGICFVHSDVCVNRRETAFPCN
jgi:hypothetical protein